jgi:Fuc2NAc and GlcNAc transferase
MASYIARSFASVLAAALAAAATAALTGLVRRYALARSVVDVPNERSSHRAPTPRGGGLAIVAAVLAGTLAGWAAGVVPGDLAAACVVGGFAVATVGWLDDHRPLPPSTRAMVHLLAAVAALVALCGAPELDLGAARLATGPVASVLAVLGIVWAINLYNFMDGIDGLAGTQVAITGGAGCLLLTLAGRPGVAFVAALLAGAGLGFLVWNWQPARIFMGDVGSGTLGFLLAVVALGSERAGGPPVLLWIMMLGVFVVDATATLVRRVWRGERWYAAHRSHAYQRLVRSGWSHRRVTTAVLLVDVALAALAYIGWRWPWTMLPSVGLGLSIVGLSYVWVERRAPMTPLDNSPQETLRGI